MQKQNIVNGTRGTNATIYFFYIEMYYGTWNVTVLHTKYLHLKQNSIKIERQSKK